MNGGLGVYGSTKEMSEIQDNKVTTKGIESFLAQGYKRRIKGKLKKIAVTKESSLFKKKKRHALKKRKHKRVPRSYRVYVESHHWTVRKNKYFRIHGKRCEVCKSGRFVQVHHKMYGNYGEEKDEHLVALCRFHHDQLHQAIGKVKKDMVEITNSLVEEMKANVPTDKECYEQELFFKSINQ